MVGNLLNRKRCPQCGAWHSHSLRMCPACGSETAAGRPDEVCSVCGASHPASQRVCPYCGAVRRTPLAGAIPVVGRVASSLAILALGAVLIWWILPLGLDPSRAPTPATQSTDTPAAASVLAAALIQESAVLTPVSGANSGVSDAAGAANLPATPGESTEDALTAFAAEVQTATPESTLDAPAAPAVEPTLTVEPTPTVDTSVHIVEQGDVLGRIAARYGVTLAALRDANGLSDTSVLRVGDRLVIPSPAASASVGTQAEPTATVPEQTPTATPAPAAASGPLLHVVAAGDTLGGIAVRYQVDSAVIADENGISLNAVLSIGQNLIIPGVGSESAPVATATPTATTMPTATPTALPTATPTSNPTPVPSATATLRATVVATAAPTSATGASAAQGRPETTATRLSTARPSATATPTAMPTPSPTLAPTLRVHVIQPGQHIGVVAALYDLTMNEIAAANGISVSSLLQVGQQLVIPGPEGAVPPATPTADTVPATSAAATAPATATVAASASATPEPQIHVVQRGDTLGGIAVRYQVDSATIAQANGLYLTSVLSIGQELVIPGITPVATPTTTESVIPTATIVLSATPTPFLYRTRPPESMYRQPRLLTPVNGAVLLGKDSAPVLQWTSVGILKSDEWYEVRLWTPDSGTEAVVSRTRATSWRMSAELYPVSRRGERFLWDVTVVRVQEGSPDVEELSLTSRQRAFRWR